MITITKINGKPSQPIPTKYLGAFDDAQNFYFAETQQEVDQLNIQFAPPVYQPGTMEYLDQEKNWGSLQYLQIRNQIWTLLIAEIGADFSGWVNLSSLRKKIAAKWILCTYALRISVLTDSEDISNFIICIEETAGIRKHDLKGRARIIEEMRQYIAINYFRKDLITKANVDDFYASVNNLLHSFEKTNAVDFRYWLLNTVNTPYETNGFKQKTYWSLELETTLNNILQGNY